MPLALLEVAVCVSIASLAYGLVLALRSRHRLPYPPGPPGYPIVGNLSFPPDPLWEKVKAMSDEYGSDVIRYRLAGRDIIYLNSHEAATELMDKRSIIYSDRPVDDMVMFRELAEMDWQFSMWTYGSEWRDGRKAFHHELRQQVVPKFRPAQKRGTYHLLRSLLQSPDDFMHHCRYYGGRVIMDIGYGIDVQDENDLWIDTAEHALEGISVMAVPGSFYVDFIPILKYVPEWVPGAGFQKIAREYRKSSLFLLSQPFQHVKDQLAQYHPDTVRTSAAKSLIQNVISKSDNKEYTEKVVKSALGTMYGAGAETVGTSLQMFILCMVLHPDVQKKAQTEIDAVCDGRLPDFSDYDRLPYMLAVVKETMRWLPVVRLNAPHRLMEDDQYKGYHISAGSIVIVNNWALLHNPNDYPNPEQYNPDRFMKTSSDGTQVFDSDVLDPEVAGVYGWGRRVCPGRFMANEEFWIAAVSLLATFDILKAKDEKGELITPTVEIANGLLNQTLLFPCAIRPRSAEHAELVLNAEV